MQAIFIAFDQAHYDAVVTLLEKNSCRGFTSFDGVKGRGSKTGVPHYGSHAWPSMAQAVLTFVEDDKLERVMAQLHELDLSRPLLGLRAFAWPVTASI